MRKVLGYFQILSKYVLVDFRINAHPNFKEFTNQLKQTISKLS